MPQKGPLDPVQSFYDIYDQLEAPPQQSNFYYSVFEQELARTGISGSAKILEIGFGAGAFLDYAAQAGHQIIGIDLVPAFVDAARNRGHTVFLGDVEAQLTELRSQGPFDLVVAFDVLEHIALGPLIRVLEGLHELLTEQGQILARVPNAGSPFGLRYMYGDFTHITALTDLRMRQLAARTGYELVFSGDGASNHSGKGGLFLRTLVSPLRRLAGFFIGYLFYGEPVPVGANLTVILKKNRGP